MKAQCMYGLTALAQTTSNPTVMRVAMIVIPFVVALVAGLLNVPTAMACVDPGSQGGGGGC